MEFLRRTWAEIDLSAFHKNIEAVKSRLSKNTRIMAVLKADAYGHGDRTLMKEAMEAGVTDFAVSNPEEGIALRKAGAKGVILLLGPTPWEWAETIARYQLTQTLPSLSYGNGLSQKAKEAGVTVRCHLKLDTGMGRIGFLPDDFSDALSLFSLPNLEITGVFSHLSSADDLSKEGVAYTEEQIRLFYSFLDEAKKQGISLPESHLLNSAGILSFPCEGLRFARAGVILYGLPVETKPENALALFPVMRLCSMVTMVKSVPAGSSIGYGRSYVTKEPAVIATVPIGYADGYPRGLGNRGEVLIRGKRAPIVGNICMDQLMVDVTHIDGVTEGTPVTLVGKDKGEEITFLELANLLGTIHYELCCGVGKRVPRVYVKDQKIVSVSDYYENE